MQLSSTMPADDCAALVLDTFPRIMHAIVPVMQQRHSSELSISQFRALMTIERHAGASLSLVSEQMGGTLSAASKLIDGLVERGFLSRETPRHDRRRMTLALTPEGLAILCAVRKAGEHQLAARLAALSEADRQTISTAMHLLQSVFAPSISEKPLPREDAHA